MRPLPAVIDAMTPFPYTIEGSESLKTAVGMMYAKEIRHLPVTSAGNLIGILTDRDAKLAMAVAKDAHDSGELRVEDVCVTDPYVVPHTEKMNVVLDHMVREHIGSALVVKNDKLVGIFTVMDACKKLSELLKLHYPDA